MVVVAEQEVAAGCNAAAVVVVVVDRDAAADVDADAIVAVNIDAILNFAALDDVADAVEDVDLDRDA